jgi:hypothetical protein
MELWIAVKPQLILLRFVPWMNLLSNHLADELDPVVWANLNVWPERKLLEVERVLETVAEQEFWVLSGNQKTIRPETLGLGRNILVKPGEIELSVTPSSMSRRNLV